MSGYAIAKICGSGEYPRLHGTVRFTQKRNGVLVTAEIYGLPCQETQFFGFHIHEGHCCAGTEEAPFEQAGSHYNPGDAAHPEHAGDLPPLLGNNGYAFMSVFTSRFTVPEILGRVVIIHRNPDDFTTQPSGNAGKMIACGRIRGKE